MKADRICSWCNKKMGPGETQDGSPTHGICRKCASEYDKELGGCGADVLYIILILVAVVGVIVLAHIS